MTAVPLFVTYGDISPRRGENLSLPGEAFRQKDKLSLLWSKKLPLSGELPSECEAERVHNIKENNKL